MSTLRKRVIAWESFLILLLCFGTFAFSYDKVQGQCGGNPFPQLQTDLVLTEQPIRKLSVYEFEGREQIAMGFLGGGVSIFSPAERFFDWIEMCNIPETSQSATVNDVLPMFGMLTVATDGSGPVFLKAPWRSDDIVLLSQTSWTTQQDSHLYDLLTIREQSVLAMSWDGIYEFDVNGWKTSEYNPPPGASRKFHRCIRQDATDEWYFICGTIDNGLVQLTQEVYGHASWFQVRGNTQPEEYNEQTKLWQPVKDVIGNFTSNIRDILVTPEGKILIAGDSDTVNVPALFYYNPSDISIEPIDTHEYRNITGIAVTQDGKIVGADYKKGAFIVNGEVLTTVPSRDVAVGKTGTIYIGTDSGLIIHK